MGKWDRMDELAWENSEVAQEFEKYILDTVARFEHLAQLHKKASGLSDLAEESEKAGDSIKSTTESVERLDTALDSINSAEDKEAEEGFDSETEVVEADDSLAAKASLINELLKKAHAAADAGDIILAYKIERAIEELEES